MNFYRWSVSDAVILYCKFDSCCYFVADIAAILLDLDAVDLPSIATNIVEQLVHSGQLCPDVQGHVLHALLLKHRSVPVMSLCDDLVNALHECSIHQ